MEVALHLQLAQSELWPLGLTKRGPCADPVSIGQAAMVIANYIPHSKAVMEKQVKVKTSMNEM